RTRSVAGQARDGELPDGARHSQLVRQRAPVAFCHGFAGLRLDLSVNYLRRTGRQVRWRSERGARTVGLSRGSSRGGEFERKPSSLSRGTESRSPQQRVHCELELPTTLIQNGLCLRPKNGGILRLFPYTGDRIHLPPARSRQRTRTSTISP